MHSSWDLLLLTWYTRTVLTRSVCMSGASSAHWSGTARGSYSDPGDPGLLSPLPYIIPNLYGEYKWWTEGRRQRYLWCRIVCLNYRRTLSPLLQWEEQSGPSSQSCRLWVWRSRWAMAKFWRGSRVPLLQTKGIIVIGKEEKSVFGVDSWTAMALARPSSANSAILSPALAILLKRWLLVGRLILAKWRIIWRGQDGMDGMNSAWWWNELRS